MQYYIWSVLSNPVVVWCYSSQMKGLKPVQVGVFYLTLQICIESCKSAIFNNNLDKDNNSSMLLTCHHNRLNVLNGKIKYDWLNLSTETFKIKMKTFSFQVINNIVADYLKKWQDKLLKTNAYKISITWQTDNFFL